MFKKTTMSAKEKLQSLEFNLKKLGLTKPDEDPILTLIAIMEKQARVEQGQLFGRLDKIRYEIERCVKGGLFESFDKGVRFKQMLQDLAFAANEVGILEAKLREQREVTGRPTPGIEVHAERMIRRIMDMAMIAGESPIKIRLPAFLEGVLFQHRIKPNSFPSLYPMTHAYNGTPISWEKHLQHIILETEQGGIFTEKGKVEL